MSRIELRSLGKTFGNFTAVKDVDLTVEEGEFMALLGPSGCGKSTTMNMIAGMEAPTSGNIYFGEGEVSRVPMGRRGVGFVFQNYAIFTHMTVRENLSYGPRMHGLPRKEVDQRVRDMADLLELTPILDKTSAQLSVNILQRLAIGRSAILEPAIFLLDEPLSNVDAAFRAVMRTELKQLQRRFGQTMMYVTHDQLEAMTMADRIAVMNEGQFQQIGTPLEVYNDPANVFVAKFIGAPGMNLIEGRVEGTSDSLRVLLPDLGQSVPLAPDLAAALRDSGERDIWFGVRPEQVDVSDHTDALGFDVVVTERIGARTIVHLQRNGTDARAVLDNGAAPRSGDRIGIVPQPGTVRLFSRNTGLRIGGGHGQN